jgi:hypothetical protein
MLLKLGENLFQNIKKEKLIKMFKKAKRWRLTTKLYTFDELRKTSSD